jgi:DNA-directed RNA polymerase specialized sigma24 family protein
MIADKSPLDRIGPRSYLQNTSQTLRISGDQQRDHLGCFFSTLSWTDSQVLALHFAEGLSPWEIHVVLDIPLSDVHCRILRLRIYARQSLQASGNGAPQYLKLRS